MMKYAINTITFMLYVYLLLLGTVALAFQLKAHHFKPVPSEVYPDIVFAVHTPEGHGTGWVLKYQNKFYVVTAAHVCAASPEVIYLKHLAKPLLVDFRHDTCVIPWVLKTPPKRYFTLSAMTPTTLEKVEIFSRTNPKQEWTLSGYFIRSTRFEDSSMDMDYDSYQLSAVPAPGTSGGPVVRAGTREVLCVVTLVYYYRNIDGSPHYYMGECVSSLDVLQTMGGIK